MGLSSSNSNLLTSSEEIHWENPSEKHEATLYYFAGRGLADQIRWMLAASDIAFTQKIISQRYQLLRMSDRQLPFGQLPLLQIDGIEIVQSQSAVRYLAKRGNLVGKTAEENLKCDMIVEAVKDLLGLVTSAPFKRVAAAKKQKERSSQKTTTIPADTSPPSPVPAAEEETEDTIWQPHLKLMKDKWAFFANRFEAILRSNNRHLPSNDEAAQKESKAAETANKAVFLVGQGLTYADVLIAHITTWFVEECGVEIVAEMPLLVALQNQIISLPGVKKFIKSIYYFPIGDEAYVEQVQKVLARQIS